MDWVERRGARGKITHVTITFYPKDDDATNAAADEAERHSTGRRSRREGTAEAIVDAASLSAVAATRMSVSDTLRWLADDRVEEVKIADLSEIVRALSLEERRVGKECVSRCKSLGSRHLLKKKNKTRAIMT